MVLNKEINDQTSTEKEESVEAENSIIYAGRNGGPAPQ